MKTNQIPPPPARYSLGYSLKFMFSRKRIFGWSTMLFLATCTITAIGFTFSADYLDSLSAYILSTPPDSSTIWGVIKYKSWQAGKFLYLIITRIIAFYLAFLVAYCITTPGYVFLSIAAEKIHAGQHFEPDENMSVKLFLIDLFEGIKIGLFGILVTIGALFMNFIPLIGQAAVFLIYTYYSALMFIDFPASRKHWSLGRKILWVRKHPSDSFRIGVLPALLSMIPLINIFLLSLFFPLLTVYSTLNFCSIESTQKKMSAVRDKR